MASVESDADITIPALRIELLGGLRVSVGGIAVAESAWRLRKARAIVKLLALADGRRMTQDALLELLWPEHDPDAAVNNFHRTLYAARSALGDAGLLRLHQGLLSLGNAASPDTAWIDVEAFTAAATEARRSTDPVRYEQAIALYAGDLLPEDVYEDWAANSREALRRDFLSLLLELARLYENQSQPDAAIAPLRRALVTDPLHEDAWRGLLRALAGSGQAYEALVQYERLHAALADELDAEPDAATTQLANDIRAGRYPTALPAPPLRPDRPVLPVEGTSFIGRERELIEVEGFLSTARVVTLTGPGGVGKSRIALRVAARLADSLRDGAAFVALDVVNDADGVLAAVARAVGVREAGERSLHDAVLLRLRPAQMLLLLDNAEHVMDSAHLIAEIAATCPDVTLLVTSRERLRIAAEQEVPIHPLPLPTPVDAPNDASEEWAVVRLFVERARAVDPAFALTPENTGDILALCSQLDALPLAIELAAARVKLLTPQAMRERLARERTRLDLLAGGARDLPERQRTMRGAVAWSYQLLAPAEQTLLHWLAVCPSGCTLELAEALVRERDGAAPDLFEHVATLVDRSLLRRVETGGGGEPRFAMLETIREFALEQLTAVGERTAAERALALALIDLAEQASAESTGARQSYWLRRIDAEHGNLRGTLAWLVAAQSPADLGLGLRLGAVLWRFWYVQGFLSEGRGWLDALLARTETVRSVARGRTLLGAAVLAQSQGDFKTAAGYLDACIDLSRELDDLEGRALALNQRGLVYRDNGQLATAEETIAEGLEIFEKLNQPWGVALSLNNLGVIAQRERDYDRSSELLEESLRLFRVAGDIWAATMPLASLSQVALDRRDFERAARLSQESLRVYEAMGDTRNVAIAYSKLARVAEARGELSEAAEHSRASLRLRRDLGDREGIIAAIERLAAIAMAQGSLERAVTLLATASGLREQIGAPPSSEAQHEHARVHDAARSALDDAELAGAWGAGWMLSFDDAVALAGSDG